MKVTIITLVVLLLCSCAAYTYKGMSCEVSIYSMRAVDSGRITIDEHCNVTAGAIGVDSSTLLNEAIKRIPVK